MRVKEGVTITPQRSNPDFGEDSWSDLSPIEKAVFDLDKPSATTQSVRDGDGGKPYMQAGSLFVPRGSDLKDGDRVTYQGKTYGVVGDRQWDQNHPSTQHDFGYMEFGLRLGG